MPKTLATKAAPSLKPIRLRLDPDPSMSAKDWELLRRRVYEVVARLVSTSGLEVKSGDDP